MIVDNLTIALGTICLTAAGVVVISEWQNWQTARAISKTIASTAFIALAAVNGAASTTYGPLILAALVFSWLGDLFLLSLRSTFLLAGIASFLCAHVVFATAFMSRPLDTMWLGIALGVLASASLICLRWLWPHLAGFYKVAVPVYLAAISIMTALAVAVSSASMSPLLAAAAISFAASDISVARDRFVSRSIVNKAWGLPLYYAAQVLFAVSVLLIK